ncbi:hypothetical protein CDL15_Pgr027957 [Punica granatum]|uniref:Uncharacterized protein n=1 Tax=Punica granatum TaxID=22663 RepID=A0A218XK68_PUNGR|nr:hypothetical protein CDL15_Pgr027957 [Punica granatum]
MDRVESDRIARPKEKPPGRDAGPNWGVGPNGPNFWAGPAKQGNGPRPVSEERPGSGGAAAAARLRAAVLAPGCRDDGTRGLGRWPLTPPTPHRGRSKPHRSLGGRNRGEFRDFPATVPESTDLQIGPIESKISVSSCWVVFPSIRIAFPLNSNSFSVKISADLAEIAKIAIWRFLGWRGSRAAGERCPACPNCSNLFFF